MLLFLLSLCLPPAPRALPTRDDLSQALRGLDSDSAEERRLAERWLAAHLARPDFARVAEVATGGSMEVRARLCNALSVDRNLGLAALFATDQEPRLRTLGDEALMRALSRWYGADPAVQASGPPVAESKPELDRFLAAYPPTHALVDADEAPGVLLDRIARFVDSRQEVRPEADAVTLIVAPEIWSRPADPEATAASPPAGYGTLVEWVALRNQAKLRGFRLAGRRPVLLVEDGAVSGGGLFPRAVEWVRAVEKEGPLASGAARALAELRWPAALAWLEERWGAGDAAALEGLVLAAGHGRVAPRLYQPETVRVLARRLADEATSPAQRDEILRALIALGGLGSAGEDLSPGLVAEWSDAARGKHSRFASIACARVHAAWSRAPEELRTAWRAWLAETPEAARAAGREPGERLAALHALAATGGAMELVIGDGAGLLAEARAYGVVDAAMAWMQGVGAALPDAWRAPDAPLAVRCALLEHLLARGDEGAAKLLAELVQADVDPLLLADVLARQRGRRGGDSVRRVLLAAELPDVPRARLALLAGAPLPGSEDRIFESLATPRTPLDQLVIGALFALPGKADGERYGVALLELVRAGLAASTQSKPGTMEDPWVLACRRAIDDLLARGEDERAEKLLRELRGATGKSTNHPLFRALQSRAGGAWPPPPGLVPEPLVEPFELRLE